jgi:hypothetical protein
MTTGRMYLISWIASSRIAIAAVVFAVWATFGSKCCLADSLVGVVFSNHSGQGPHASGAIELAVGARTYILYYGEPLTKRFEGHVCYDIGAIWSVVFDVLPDSTRELKTVSCSGETDAVGHAAWSLARRYLNSTPSASSFELLSANWRSTSAFVTFESEARKLDLTGYHRFGKNGGCIDILSIEQPDAAELRAGADCDLELSGAPVYLLFRVVRHTHTDRWEIADIQIQRPPLTHQ